MEKYIVKDEEKNIRIDKIVNIIKQDISRTAIQRMIEEGNILVNGNIVRTSYKVNKDDVITIENEEPKEIELSAENIPLDIIYEDKDILIVNKPQGMVVHPGNRKSRWYTCECCFGSLP